MLIRAIGGLVVGSLTVSVTAQDITCDIILHDVPGPHSTSLWPEGIVPYEFDANVSMENQQTALDVMAMIEGLGTVDFVVRTTEMTWVIWEDSDRNSAHVGRRSSAGTQNIRILSWGNDYIIAHEVLHCLGFWHEQQRADRDSFVQIETGNIEPMREHNFNIQSTLGTYQPYDFDSVMHYGQCAFSTCGDCANDPESCRTITVLEPNEGWQDDIGQRVHLSMRDEAGVAYLYPPNDDCEDAISIFGSGDNVLPIHTSSATDSATNPCSLFKDRWFSLVPLHSGVVRISLCESEFDGGVAVYSGLDCSTATLVACATTQDCGDGTTNAILEFPALQDEEFLIQVGGTTDDEHGGGILDVFVPCFGDLDADGQVGILDLLAVLATWGTPEGDVDGDGDTGILDFLAVLSNWGSCS